MGHIKSTYKYLIVIGIGLAIFLVDYFELINTLSNEIVLSVLSLLKAGYFIYFVFGTIKETAHKEFDFHEFLGFVVLSILLVILSFAIDYYCLFRINAHSFAGVIAKQNIITEFISFFYYSISVFTTAGFGDIKPNSTSAQIFVSTELMIAFFFTILVIANITHIRASFKEKVKE
ncbi:MAG TPA: ion channel [Ferruginibacter sp.]|nr:ion channel [Ferruginibacter sp.]